MVPVTNQTWRGLWSYLSGSSLGIGRGYFRSRNSFSPPPLCGLFVGSLQEDRMNGVRQNGRQTIRRFDIKRRNYFRPKKYSKYIMSPTKSRIIKTSVLLFYFTYDRSDVSERKYTRMFVD